MARGDRALGQQLAERPAQHLREALDGQVPGRDGRRERGPQDRPLGARDPHVPGEAVVLGHLGADKAPHGEVGGGVAARPRDVHAASHLGARLPRRRPRASRRAPAPGRGCAPAGRSSRRRRRGSPRPRPPSSASSRSSARARADVPSSSPSIPASTSPAVAAAQLDEPLAAAAAGRELRLEVARRGVRVAHVRADQVPQAAGPAAALDEEHGREDQPLLVELGVLGVLGPRRRAADVDVVGDRPGVADQPPAGVDAARRSGGRGGACRPCRGGSRGRRRRAGAGPAPRARPRG